jgi:serine/threonine protein kinase
VKEVRGAKDAQQLKPCPHLVRTFGIFSMSPVKIGATTVGSSDDHIEFIVMELCCRLDIMTFLEQKKTFTPQLARHFFRQLMRGIKALHEACVVHRDIKPDNLLLDPLFNLKIADFGTARNLNSKSMNSRVTTLGVGAPSFRSPENFGKSLRDAETVAESTTRASDIWKAGVTLYVMLTGCFPFGSPRSTPAEVTNMFAMLDDCEEPRSERFWGLEQINRAAALTMMPPKMASDRCFGSVPPGRRSRRSDDRLLIQDLLSNMWNRWRRRGGA